jgi:O-antigen/teichoic acid export membrane protein
MLSYRLYLDRIAGWIFKFGYGILDQGFYSGANFLLSILLARWLSVDAYGAFSAVYSIFLLVATLQVALIAEPMSIMGADKYVNTVVGYLNYLLRIQWIGSSALAFVFVIVSLLFVHDRLLLENLISMALAMPVIFFYWYLRRALYLRAQSKLAMVTSFAYILSLILQIIGWRLFDRLSIETAYSSMAVSSLFASFFIMKILGVKIFGLGSLRANLNPDIVHAELWGFGKWLMFAYVANWLTVISYPLLITIYINAEFAGVFRAIQNLFLPFQQFLAAITLLVLPWLTIQRADKGDAQLLTATRHIAWVVGFVALFYCIGITVFRNAIMHFLYANEMYSNFSGLTPYLALATLIGAVHIILGLALRIVRQANIILWSKGIAALFFLTFAAPIIGRFQTEGILFLLIAAALIEAFIVVFFYFRVERTIELTG